MGPNTTARALLEELEGIPLLGSGLERAQQLRRAATRQLASHPEPRLQLRARLRFGELLLALDAPDTASFLVELARTASEGHHQALATRASLLAVRALCRAGDIPGAQTMLEQCDAAQLALPAHRIDLLLARAWLGSMDAAAQLQEAIEDLPPERDHDRLAALLELADRCELGGDPYRARASLEQALALAAHHQAHRQGARAALQLGSLLLRTGELEAAERSLERALELSTRADDGLARAASGLLLSSLLLGRARWGELLGLTEPLPALARQRHNPAMLASLALDRACALWALERPVEALAELMACSAELAPHPQPLELIRARFAELLDEVGPERFQALVTEAAGRMRG
jgi:tetratricopeptide (TPR) repeat protein